MSYKTDRLIKLFPYAYAAKSPDSLLYKLLDAIGEELMKVDEAVKQLLKSHWVDYAEGNALDGLGAIYGLKRRLLPDETQEDDDTFRRRLKLIVHQFTGGGTKQAIIGAVRSALGLPFNLEQLNLPNELRADLENLIILKEFSPDEKREVGDKVQKVNGGSELTLKVNFPTVEEVLPQIDWQFVSGGGRRLRLERLDLGTGIQSDDDLVIPQKSVLKLSADSDGILNASVDDKLAVSQHFSNLDGTQSAKLPKVPIARSQWKFRAQGGLFDISKFDSGDRFDLPEFHVELRWVQYQPLTFNVYVHPDLKTEVDKLQKKYGYEDKLFQFKGLPHEKIQEVVNQTQAAGVKGEVLFSIPPS
uniref:Uncharacterized protein n=1 Tax=Tolypothrix bouteillei VB521301 TaxID=1479485 RepID=A0A0C1RE35_9CYAN